MVNHRKAERPPTPEEPIQASRGIFGEYLKSLSSISDAYVRASTCEDSLSFIKKTPGLNSAQNERAIMVLYIEAINEIRDGKKRTTMMEQAIELISKSPHLRDLIDVGADWQSNESRTITSKIITSMSSFFNSAVGIILLLICAMLMAFPLMFGSFACAIRLADWILGLSRKR